MTRLLPYPWMSAFLLAVWLLLNQSVSAGHIGLGCVLAIIGGRVMTAVAPPKASLRRPGAILRLTARVLADILRSNVAVARIILGLAQPPNSGFVRIPLDLRSPYSLAALAVIITSTPGTVWADFDSGTRILVIHVLDLVDESDWVRTVKRRYEPLLLEIFE
jgi:multicomponent K+:H+ antiporter subunit E